MLLSLGLNMKLGDWQPYELLRMYYPGFQKLRSPFRFTVFAQIFLVLFAGWALSELAKRRLWLAVLATAVCVLELLSAPINLYRFSIDVISRSLDCLYAGAEGGGYGNGALSCRWERPQF